jgi:hypothetical protein
VTEIYEKIEVSAVSRLEGEDLFEIDLRRPNADAIVFWIRRRDLQKLREQIVEAMDIIT